MDYEQRNTLVNLITGREESLFSEDVLAARSKLQAALEGASVLVIGGAGSIGSAFVKELCKGYSPSKIHIVDLNENALAELTRDIRGNNSVSAEISFYPISFGDGYFTDFLSENGPYDLVLNFAALKHVRSAKEKFSLARMLQTNVFWPFEVLQSLEKMGWDTRFFSVSTDKAAAPASLMGASKALMEKALLLKAGKVPVMSSRFANVALSNGSLPASWIHRLEKRQALVCPRNISRYFLSEQEAAHLCLLGAVFGDSGQIFIPKLGENELKPFPELLEHFLAVHKLNPNFCKTEGEATIAAANWKPGQAYPVYLFDSSTSGEKEKEVFVGPGEVIQSDMYSRVEVITGISSHQGSGPIYEELIALFNALDEKEFEDIVAWMESHLSHFNRINRGRNLDQGM